MELRSLKPQTHPRTHEHTHACTRENAHARTKPYTRTHVHTRAHTYHTHTQARNFSADGQAWDARMVQSITNITKRLGHERTAEAVAALKASKPSVQTDQAQAQASLR